MKEPRRLLSQGATDFERQLLRAVVNERPSALLRSRMQRGLGLVGPLAWASTVKAMLGGAAGKITGIVALGVLAAAGITAINLVPESPAGGVTPQGLVASESSPAAAERVEPTAPSPIVVEPRTEPEVAAETTPSGPSAVSSASAEASAPEAQPSAPPEAAEVDDRQLREEIALLDAARAALESGDRGAARDSLRTYRERFPAGVLAREANVLRRRAEPARARPKAER